MRIFTPFQRIIRYFQTWPLFRPIPAEHYALVKSKLCAELYRNTRLAAWALLAAVLLYYYLLSAELPLSGEIVWLSTQLGIGAFILVNINYFAEHWVTSIRYRVMVLNGGAFLFAVFIGMGFYFQVPQLQNTYRIATAYALIVGVSGAGAFIFTVNPTTFILFIIPFVGPIVYWLWFKSPDGTAAVLGHLSLPFYTVLYFVSLIEYRNRVNLIVTDAELKKEQEKLRAEEALSRKLLLNILPVEIADELKINGNAKPVEYPSVTVLFTDFVGFTRIAETMSPRELIDELDKCFSYFDQVAEKYKLEKLKTIGDSFMCAGGIPRSNRTHTIDCALAALEIREFMAQMQEIRTTQNLPYWQLRIGINTGPLVAGVVGTHKFAYDIWGDTVNTASRMESGGEVGRINISGSTHAELRFLFECEYRGQIKAKNKGEVPMYFLNGIKAKFCRDGGSRVPNDEFLSLYTKIENGARLMPNTAKPRVTPV